MVEIFNAIIAISTMGSSRRPVDTAFCNYLKNLQVLQNFSFKKWDLFTKRFIIYLDLCNPDFRTSLCGAFTNSSDSS
jgi:hypothetical protein